MSTDRYQEIEERAARLRELRSQLAAEEIAFKVFVDAGSKRATQGDPAPKQPLKAPKPKYVAGREKPKPAEVDPDLERRGSRLGDRTKALLRHLKAHPDSTRAANAKAYTGRDDKAAKASLDKRMWALRKTGTIRKRADGTHEVLIEV